MIDPETAIIAAVAIVSILALIPGTSSQNNARPTPRHAKHLNIHKPTKLKRKP
jgi:hypothetical protein